MKFALISDIHGNVDALSKVLSDIRKRNIDKIYNLGDSFYGPLDSCLTYKIITETHNMVSIRGNSDRKLLPPISDSDSNTIRQNKEEMSKEQYDWINNLPLTIRENGMLFCHGAPSDDTHYLLEQMGENGSCLKSEVEILKTLELDNVTEDIIFCGHTHIPRFVITQTGKTIINPGSIGLQAFDDEHPIFHKMESGSPFAKYAIIEVEANKIKHVEFICVLYDYEKAYKKALENSREDWAGAIKFGRMVNL